MATARAQVEPELLRWARKSIGYSLEEAAKKAGQKPERLDAWERGERQPTTAQLRRLADVYRRPLAVFFLAEPPKDFQAIRDFRRLPEAAVGEFTPALRAAMLDAHDLRESALELAELLGEDLIEWTTGSGSQDPEELGQELRSLVAVSVNEQMAWREPAIALRAWIRAVEDLGALVAQVQRIPVDEMRGFSISAEVMPLIVLNGADAPRGKIFTLFHELAHLVLNVSGVCDLHAMRQPGTQADRIEVFCNRAAAAALLPQQQFLGALTAEPVDGRWSDQALGRVADSFSVSREVVLRRLLTFNRTTWDYYREKHAEYAEAYRYEREREREERQQADAPPIYYPLKVRDLGRRYVDLALDAYHSAAISTAEAAAYLDVKAANLPGLEREVRRRTGVG